MKRLPLILVALVAACHKHEPTPLGQAQPSESASTPIDHLAEGELLEGDAKAFGLTLPRGMRIDAAFADVAFASGTSPPERVARSDYTTAVTRYVRARVREGKMIEPTWDHPYRTTFDHVRVPAMPDKELVVDVEPKGGAVQIVIHDVTASPAPKLPDEAARWQAAGLKPNGQPLDPQKMQ